MTFYKYTATVVHDTGSFTINVIAQSEDAAREIICQVESCPPRAIKTITQGEQV